MWLDWSPAAFAQAEAERKPVLLSLVTAWSDECAQLDRTTYSDRDVAALIARRYVAVRVDADRRPDISERYSLGGWPTTAFLTSAGETLSAANFLDVSQMLAGLDAVADAYRDRATEIFARRGRLSGALRDKSLAALDPTFVLTSFRSLLIEGFDAVNGGFGSAPKLPHPQALAFALSLAGEGDARAASIASITLRQMEKLWDSEGGGFFRYAESDDWNVPGSGKTLEDNAALLNVYVEAALQLRDADFHARSSAIVKWVKAEMADIANGGFYNAESSYDRDTTMYVDKNAAMMSAFIRAAALFDDIWLRDFALKSLEAVVVPSYKPGSGVGHVSGSDDVRNLLTDQIHVASALIWAHAATGSLPYSMLAAEILQFAVRTMWDESAGAFRDRLDPEYPLVPFELNCQAACVFDRMAVLTGDDRYQDRARTILQSLSADYRYDLFGAPYALAVREVFGRRPPAGLELSRVDWQLGT